MPACLHPVTPHDQRVRIVVEVQRIGSRSTNWRQPNDVDAVIAPAKMIVPALCARIEQWLNVTAFGIDACGFVTFVAVAQGARQPQVAFVVRAALRDGDNVFDLQPRHHEVLRTEAVSAAILCSLTDATVEIDGNTVT